jgi:hypothetical protein
MLKYDFFFKTAYIKFFDIYDQYMLGMTNMHFIRILKAFWAPNPRCLWIYIHAKTHYKSFAELDIWACTRLKVVKTSKYNMKIYTYFAQQLLDPTPGSKCVNFDLFKSRGLITFVYLDTGYSMKLCVWCSCRAI